MIKWIYEWQWYLLDLFMYGGGVFCELSLHYDSTIRLLIVNNIVIVTIDFNINNDSDQYTILSLIYLY